MLGGGESLGDGPRSVLPVVPSSLCFLTPICCQLTSSGPSPMVCWCTVNPEQGSQLSMTSENLRPPNTFPSLKFFLSYTLVPLTGKVNKARGCVLWFSILIFPSTLVALTCSSVATVANCLRTQNSDSCSS